MMKTSSSKSMLVWFSFSLPFFALVVKPSYKDCPGCDPGEVRGEEEENHETMWGCRCPSLTLPCLP